MPAWRSVRLGQIVILLPFVLMQNGADDRKNLGERALWLGSR
jgi:hypothetical protein